MEYTTEGGALSILNNSEYFWIVGVLLVFAILYIYFLHRKHKKLTEIVKHKVDVFEKAFDISEDAVTRGAKTGSVKSC